jgi:hypothetical protein
MQYLNQLDTKLFQRLKQNTFLNSHLIYFRQLKIHIQCSPLNGITVNGIIRLMGSILYGIQGLIGLGKARCLSVNGIIRLMESVRLGPKVIPLSGAPCNCNVSRSP